MERLREQDEGFENREGERENETLFAALKE